MTFEMGDMYKIEHLLELSNLCKCVASCEMGINKNDLQMIIEPP